MTKNIQNFTKALLDSLEPSPNKGRYIVYDANQTGLGIRVSEYGKKSFIVYKKHKGNPVKVTIGHYPEMTIYEARKATVEILSQLNKGDNPNKDKQDYRNTQTLRELYEEFMERYSKKEKKSWKHDEMDIPRFFGHWFNRKINDITTEEIQELFEKITIENGKYQANHALERLRAMYNKAIKWKWINKNPTTGIEKNTTKSRDRYLSEEEFKRFSQALDNQTLIHKSFFLLLLYTGARKSNMLSMKWSDIDFNIGQWRIPDTKNGNPVVIPLIDQAREILDKLPKDSIWVFPNPDNPDKHYVCMKKPWQKLLKDAQIENLRMHDLRRTLASWQAINGTSLLIIGNSLGHKSTKSTEVYARLMTNPVQNSMQSAIDRLTGKNN